MASYQSDKSKVIDEDLSSFRTVINVGGIKRSIMLPSGMSVIQSSDAVSKLNDAHKQKTDYTGLWIAAAAAALVGGIVLIAND
jgi:hypothetical protein